MKILFYSTGAILLFLAGCRSSILEDPVMTIQYSVPQASHVTLTLENSYNTVIATLVDADKLPGEYRVVFDAGGLQEGIYFYTIECKGLQGNYYFKSTQKTVILK